MTRAANALKRGYVLTLDYGYEAADLYASWRKRGTLLTFYRHTSDEDPYARIGRQDITASVDFTTVVRAGEAAGLQHVARWHRRRSTSPPSASATRSLSRRPPATSRRTTRCGARLLS